MTTSEIRHLERYMEFHRVQILEHLRSNHDGDSDADSERNGKHSSPISGLKDCLLRSREQIESALARIREGTYGNCVGCGDEIGLRVLEMVPWTQFCTSCQEGFRQRQQAE